MDGVKKEEGVCLCVRKGLIYVSMLGSLLLIILVIMKKSDNSEDYKNKIIFDTTKISYLKCVCYDNY